MAFHPYPQLIPRVFNLGGFGPPRDFTRASTWPWIDHLVSGLLHATGRRLRLAFATPTSLDLSLPHRVTHRLIMQKARSRSGRSHRAPTACRHSVSGTISLPSLGYFSPFPHGTSSLSVAREYLALEGGPPIFRQGFSCPALLWKR